MKIYHNISELAGNTPLIELTAEPCRILAKVEFFNPAGSTKDRAALRMLKDAEERGVLRPGGTVIEPTSGNTGIGLAAMTRGKDYRVIIVMPDSMSRERQLLMKAYGAELVLTPGSEGMTGAINKARELAEEIPGSFIPDQFNNPANALAHYETTGPEIWRDTEGQIDIFCAGFGTGGTLSGIGRYLKEQKPDIHIAGVEPAGSPFVSLGVSGKHGLMGIGAGFVPGNLDLSLIDEVIAVSDSDAYECGRELARRWGLMCGITSGAALAGAYRLAEQEENHGKTIVIVLPDTGERYLSSPMFEE